ncbi:MAG: gliding motility-associated ABC transporter ATP-binding subunit GldA [Bacteroidia bacterium]|nr:gliding motility-associated ABC transporter ATP-binding subunit GldA [Bacteroidia bacterium]MDW8158775.1 gliding motility-associated ABC transporter ATP-binding subunit GldA [Bacteroidia bacterium]
MALRVKGLTKFYGSQKAIENINFTIQRGEIVGFLGPNGAGKSTTMKIITGYLPPTSGTVELGEWNIFEHPLEVRKRIGYLPENNPLYLDMYVREFLYFIARLFRLSSTFAHKRINEVIEQVGLGPEQHKKIGMLSKGYRQRVGLAQAIIHDPDLLILDEPTSGLDPNQVIEIRKLIEQLGKEKTVLFSSHILSEVEAISQRVIIINKGTLLADEPIHQLYHLTGENEKLILEVDTIGLSKENLEEIEGVIEVQVLQPTCFAITVSDIASSRKTISNYVTQQGFMVLTLQKEEKNLEDIFRKLTQKTE